MAVAAALEVAVAPVRREGQGMCTRVAHGNEDGVGLNGEVGGTPRRWHDSGRW